MNNYFIIDTPLTTQNEMIGFARMHKMAAAGRKKKDTNTVAWFARQQVKTPIIGRKWYVLEFTILDFRKNPDNIESTKKAIFDGMQEAKIIDNDGFKQTASAWACFKKAEKNERETTKVLWFDTYRQATEHINQFYDKYDNFNKL